MMNHFRLSNIQQSSVLIQQWMDRIEKVVIGRREAIEHLIIAMLSGGHVMIEDVPGVGKTLLAKTLSQSIDCDFTRIQCNPDLMPSDLTGITIYNQKSGEFEFRHGPLQSNLVLVDELNRTSPRTQSALLEAMEERAVTVDGVSHALPRPFMVVATQNPADYEGTYPLPEAQLDRFMLKIELGYPKHADEMTMLQHRAEKYSARKIKPALFKEEVLKLKKEAFQVHVDETIYKYIVDLAHATRNHPEVKLGISPRGSFALMRASQARALVKGRSYCLPEDVQHMCSFVFPHRLLCFGGTADHVNNATKQVMDHILKSVHIPALKYVR
ncbi:AAA family ATPase [Longirhabdus pacifica]|uniref:AAA family ATPase n=1 Tax=Longirhabdus pacifica TaxID=2305227 RepID=UPI001F0BCBF5|nr:MoxR family ATPase [Longirhabdus pacifica]